MSQFMVPQFIEIEPKIFGPVTLRQLIYLIICGLLIFIEFKTSDLALFIVLAPITLVFFGLLGFYKVNGQPFHYFVLNFLQFGFRPCLRFWQKEELQSLPKEIETGGEKIAPVLQKFSHRKLSQLSLIVDTGGTYQDGE